MMKQKQIDRLDGRNGTETGNATDRPLKRHQPITYRLVLGRLVPDVDSGISGWIDQAIRGERGGSK